MLFSLDKSYDEIFNNNITFRQTLKIWRDICKVRKKYRKDRGFIQAIRIRPKRILFGFDMYRHSFSGSTKTTMQLWDEFVGYCKEEGAEFLDNHI